jgi:hypothetical protein
VKRGRGEKGFGEEKGEIGVHLEKRAHKRRRGRTKRRRVHKEQGCTSPTQGGTLGAITGTIY